MIMVKEFGLGSSVSVAEFQTYPQTNVFSGFDNSVSKRIKLSLHPNQQGEGCSSFRETSPLGLTLSKTPSFLNLVDTVLSQASRNKNDANHVPNRAHIEVKRNDAMCQSQSVCEKLKASNIPALSLKIGSFERSSRYDEDLIAKCYYAKKKIVWEVLEGPVKSKMEIQWSDIEAIRATIHGNVPGILEIELNQPPLFFKETNPQPRKHTLWQPTSDFTRGQALKCRKHTVHFPPGTLDKHYKKLLQCDRRLLELSRKAFPSGNFPYFQPKFYPQKISFGGQHANILTSFLQSHHLNLSSNSHFQALDLPQQDGGVNVGFFSGQGNEIWTRDENAFVKDEGLPHPVALKAQEGFDPNIVVQSESVFPSNPQFVWPDRENILARVQSMCSLLESQDGVNNMGINHLKNTQINIGNDGLSMDDSKILEYNSGLINSLPSQGLDDNSMMMNNYYQYGLSNSTVEHCEPLIASYVDHQWS